MPTPSPRRQGAPEKRGSKPAATPKKAPTAAESKARERQSRERARLAREEAARQRRLRKARRRKLFRTGFLLSLVFVVCYYAFVFCSIAFRDGGAQDAYPILVFTAGQTDYDTEWKSEAVWFDDGYYLPITVLEPYMAVSQFGDFRTRSFLLCDSGQYATFYLGTCNAIVNGERVFLENEVFLQDELLYLPVDFYEDKMNCFEYTFSSALSANVLTFLPEFEPSLRFAPSEPIPPVDYATVPVAPVVPSQPEPTPSTPTV